MTVIGYSVVEHSDDNTTRVINKVSVNDMTALVSGLATGAARPQHTYLNADACPVHGPWRAVPAGISKGSGKSYPAFWACDQDQGEERCANKPSKAWVETHPAERNDPSQFEPPEPTAAPTSQAGEFDDLPF